MIGCKHCDHDKSVNNGKVRNKQRYRRQNSGHNFVERDGTAKSNAAVRRAVAVILYALGKGSYGFIAKFGVTSAALVLK